MRAANWSLQLGANGKSSSLNFRFTNWAKLFAQQGGQFWQLRTTVEWETTVRGEARVNSIGIAKEMLEAQDSRRGETFYPDFLAVADSLGCRPALPAQTSPDGRLGRWGYYVFAPLLIKPPHTKRN